jgi:hypothetical protein
MAEIDDIAPTSWDRQPRSLAHEIAGYLESIRDEGTTVDTGFGDGTGDLWVTVGGVEFFVTIRKSNNQLAKEGKPIPSI